MLRRLLRSPMLPRVKSPHLRIQWSPRTLVTSAAATTPTARRRALAFLLLGGTSASLAAYHIQEKRLLHCDSDIEPHGLKFNTKTSFLAGKETFLNQSESYIPSSASGFSRFDFAQVASNEPVEDYHCELFVPTKGWSLFAILDGHAGWKTAAWLSEHLLPSVTRALSSTSSSSTARDEAITKTFLDLDREIVDDAAALALSSTSVEYATKVLERAHAGSCAVMGFYDAESSQLKIANTGDSRAILGRRTTSSNGEVEYVLKLLSFDHNGENPSEVKRLTALHPDEEGLFKGSRFFGWGCARAFGDGVTKWSREIQESLKKKCLGSTPYPNLKTPPYFTAEPELTTTKIEKGDILILATDGLWECLTNEEAIGLVGRWVERQTSTTAAGRADESLAAQQRVVPEDEFTRYKQWNKEKKFTFVDSDTPAQHLLRNALGGADEDLRRALLGLRSPRSRSFRDDVSVSVVIF